MYDRTFYFLLAETWDVFYGWQILYIWRKCRTSEDFFDLYISLKALFFSFPFVPLYLKLCKALPHTCFYQTGIPWCLKARYSDTPILTGFENCTPTWEWIVKFRTSLPHQRITTQVNLIFLNSGAPGEWYNCGHMSFILNAYPANFSKGNSFTATCKQPQHQSGQMESCLDHMR